MKLNWFSPLPPANTEIANYTARLLPALTRRLDLTLWTDQSTWEAGLRQYARVRHYHPDQLLWPEVNQAEMSIYQLGNNPLFHSAIWRVARQSPGIVILHDLRLHEFFDGLFHRQEGGREEYFANMQRYYGQVGLRDAEAGWARRVSPEYMIERYALTDLALENSLAVLVHSQEAFDALSGQGHRIVVYAPLPYQATKRPLKNASRVPEATTKDSPYRIVVFGFMSPNRQLDVLMTALASFPDRDKFRLDVYGDLWDAESVLAHIQSLGLHDAVAVHGFVPETELDDALDGAHLAVNLRYPSVGEASASQLRIWDHALPSLVTRTGWYAGLPRDAVAFVRPGHEIEDIHSHLHAFIATPARFARMGQKGRRILREQHTPERYIQTIGDLVEQARRFRPRAVAYRLAERVGTTISAWAAAPLPDDLFTRAAEEIRAMAR